MQGKHRRVELRGHVLALEDVRGLSVLTLDFPDAGRRGSLPIPSRHDAAAIFRTRRAVRVIVEFEEEVGHGG